MRHIAQQDRCAVRINADRYAFKIGNSLQVTLAAHHEFRLAHLDQPAANIIIGALNGMLHSGQRNAVFSQRIGIDFHLILFDKTAHRSDFRYAIHSLQGITHIPVLNRAQFGQIMLAGLIDQGIFIHPAHAGRIRPERRGDAGRQSSGHIIQILQHARSRPVHIGAVFKDNIDHRKAEKGVTAHHFGVRHSQHGRGQRIGDLILHHLRRLTGVFGEYNHLHIGEIGNGVERDILHCKTACHHQNASENQDDQFIAQTRINDFSDHGLLRL